jgi:anti-anti-sigma factor
MHTPLQVEVQTIDDQIAIINLVGDLTTQAERVVSAAYRQVSEHNVSNIIFNFRADDYIDSVGLAILINVITQARQKNQHLTMTVPSPHSQRIFNLMGINHYATIYNTLDEALQELKN